MTLARVSLGYMYFRAMSDLGSRAIVIAALLACHDKSQTASKPSWSSAIKCSGWANGRASIPPGMDSSAMLRHWCCLPAGHCTVAQADLLRAVHAQASCLQPLTAWNRQTRAAEELECCSCRACQRGVEGDPSAAGRASKLGLSWPGPSSMHCPASLMCTGRAHSASEGRVLAMC